MQTRFPVTTGCWSTITARKNHNSFYSVKPHRALGAPPSTPRFFQAHYSRACIRRTRPGAGGEARSGSARGHAGFSRFCHALPSFRHAIPTCDFLLKASCTRVPYIVGKEGPGEKHELPAQVGEAIKRVQMLPRRNRPSKQGDTRTWSSFLCVCAFCEGRLLLGSVCSEVWRVAERGIAFGDFRCTSNGWASDMNADICFSLPVFTCTSCVVLGRPAGHPKTPMVCPRYDHPHPYLSLATHQTSDALARSLSFSLPPSLSLSRSLALFSLTFSLLALSFHLSLEHGRYMVDPFTPRSR